MIKQFEKLSNEECALLFKAPVLVSVFAACSNDKVDQVKKRDAIKLAHLKTFTASPLLLPYYLEVEKNFKMQFEALSKKYFPFDTFKRGELESEVKKVLDIIGKLDKGYAQELKKSLLGYFEHVNRSMHSIFQDFIFPLPISGLNEYSKPAASTFNNL